MSFAIAAIRAAKNNLKTGVATIEAVDSKGTVRVFSVMPEALTNLITALLARPLSATSAAPPWVPQLPLNGVRRRELTNGRLALEIAIGEECWIALTFPRTALPMLQQVIGTWVLDEEKPN